LTHLIERHNINFSGQEIRLIVAIYTKGIIVLQIIIIKPLQGTFFLILTF